MTAPVLEFRIALTTSDYERLTRFYQEGLGLNPAQLWATEHTHAALFEMGRGTLELFDEAHAEAVDKIETGERTSGQIRFAIRVPDVDAALVRVLAHGATLVHAPITTPWGDYNARVMSPDGLQITLFQPPE